MNKQDFLNTKWDARDWTEDMKRKWQERMFEFGFTWQDESELVSELGASFYFIDKGKTLAYSDSLYAFNRVKNKQCAYSFAFPETQIEQGQKHDSEKPRSQPRNKYDREILPGVYVDVYDVLRVFKTNSPALDHAAKKLLASGERGHKDRITDLQECIASIQAEIDSMKEWS